MRPLNAFKKALGLNRGIGMIQLRRRFLIKCPQFAVDYRLLACSIEFH